MPNYEFGARTASVKMAGDVDVTSITPGTSAANLGKAQDAAHTSGDVGVMALAVHQSSAPSSLTDGDYVPLSINAAGELRVTTGSGGGSSDLSARTTITGSGTSTNLLCDSHGHLQVDVVSTVPGTGAAHLGKAEDAAHSSGDVGVMALAVRSDSLTAHAGASNDYSALQVNSDGALYTAASSLTQSIAATTLSNYDTAYRAFSEASTTLSQDINASVQSLTAPLDNFPQGFRTNSGSSERSYILIDSERIEYTSIFRASNAVTFSGLTRGALLSAAVGHLANATITAHYEQSTVRSTLLAMTEDGALQANGTLYGWPSQGYLQVGSEVIQYMMVTYGPSGSAAFEISARGQFGTTAVEHTASTAIVSPFASGGRLANSQSQLLGGTTEYGASYYSANLTWDLIGRQVSQVSILLALESIVGLGSSNLYWQGSNDNLHWFYIHPDELQANPLDFVGDNIAPPHMYSDVASQWLILTKLTNPPPARFLRIINASTATSTVHIPYGSISFH